MNFCQILGLYEFSGRIDFPDRLHRKNNALDLVNQHPYETVIIFQMRIPMSVQPAKSRSSERLVNRSEMLHPWISTRYRFSIIREMVWKRLVQQACERRSAAVMNQSNYRNDVILPDQLKLLITPAPVNLYSFLLFMKFPKHRISQCANIQIRECFNIIRS